jgi:hypothetical protein
MTPGDKMRHRTFNTSPKAKKQEKIKESLTRQNQRTKGKVTLPTVHIQDDE